MKATQKQLEDLSTVMRIQTLMQCVIYQMDDLSHSTLYSKTNKTRLENIYVYVSKLVETLTDGMNEIPNPDNCKDIARENKLILKEKNRYVKVTNAIEKILTKVTVTI